MKFRHHSYSSCITSVLIMVGVVLFSYTPLTSHATAASLCRPLLLMIEGGGPINLPGRSIQKLGAQLVRSYNQLGITVVNVSHIPYMRGFYFMPGRIPIAVRKLYEANYWPVVILGHSLGADTAASLAEVYPTPLLITLDGVSFNRDRLHPQSFKMNDTTYTKWINVWIPGLFFGNTLGPDWNHEPYADENIPLKGVKHNDVATMYTHVENEILNALRTCPIGVFVQPHPEKLCEMPGVQCQHGVPLAG